MIIQKAVFPVAGLGTRFLPATKVIPKEMLPIVDKPIIQYATEEAINAGIKELIFVISKTKMSIRDHYSEAHELNAELLKKEKHDLVQMVSDVVPSGIQCFYVNQPQALGLGHAVLCAKELVGNEPFAVVLPDDMIDDNSRGCLSQMVDVYQHNKTSIVAVENVDPLETDKYGIVSAEPVTNSLHKIFDLVEKPSPEESPSSMAVVGRYILTLSIFNLLENLEKGAGGEIQLTDGIKKLLEMETVLAYEFSGTRYDCGSKLGYLKANLNYALKDPDIRSDLLEHIANLNAS
ncbi:MAG: UTP--glucose-1-phosphate uridylyltransferase [Gammaproteobacteria bacterium]|jgi:UTP--glucose-1-phosphate uridylyltransferase